MVQESFNLSLAIGGFLSLIASLLHVGIIIVGARWYRFFGAGERFAQAAERGERLPDIVTAGIALVLLSWALFGFSGSGLIPVLPMLKPALLAIASIYLLRALAIIPLFLFARAKTTPFLLWSSLVCFGFALAYWIGIAQISGWQV